MPARSELWSNYDEHYGHFRRFDRPGLRALFRSSGFGVLESGYFFHSLYPAALLLKTIHGERAVAIRAPDPNKVGLHHLVASLFQIEYRLLPRSLPGTSCYAVLRRQG